MSFRYIRQFREAVALRYSWLPGYKLALRKAIGLKHLAALTVLAASSTPLPAQDIDCDTYAIDYANRFVGSGDMVGDAVEGGMKGAVVGGAWRGPSGAKRGARAGGALGVLNNIGSDPRAWEGFYDMAYQMCVAQKMAVGASDPNCRSSATVGNSNGGLSASSGLSAGSSGSCR